jgi:hypothetical protein
MNQPGVLLGPDGQPVSLVTNERIIPLTEDETLKNTDPLIPFNPMGLPNMVGGTNTQELSQWDTLFANLRWYLVSNNRQLISQLISEIGLVRTICDVPVSDGLRGGIEVKTEQLDEKQIKQLLRFMELKKDIWVAGRAISKCRGFGGGGVVVLTDQDPQSELDMDAIRPDTPVEFKAADLWELFWDMQNTQTPEQYDPSIAIENVEWYRYYSVSVHKSRVMPLIGIDPPSFIRPRLRGWGLSELEILVRGINQFLKSNNLAFEVLDEFKVDVYKIKNLVNSLLTPVGQANVRARVTLSNQIKNFQNALVMDAEDDFDHKQLSFAGIAEMMAQFRIQIASDMRMPITKLFGISAAGFNSGEDDIEVYNGMVESEIRGKIKHPLLIITSIRCQQLFGFVPDDLEIGLKPLRVLSAEGEEKVKDSKFTRLLAAATSNKITDLEFRERCNHDNLLGKPLDTEDARLNPDELKEEPEPGEEPAKPAEGKKSALDSPEPKQAKNSFGKWLRKLINGEFREADHPRDKDGEFTSGSGGKKIKSTETIKFKPSEYGRGGGGLSDNIETERNPSHEDIVSMLRRSQEKSLRYAIDPDGNIYFWDAADQDHKTISQQIGSHKIPKWKDGNDVINISQGEIFDLETLEMAEENLRMVRTGKYLKNAMYGADGLDGIRDEYEKDGGDSKFTTEELTEAINHAENGPLWEKAKEASQSAFGIIKWPFVMWWYKRNGGDEK